jgi:outer membrane protein assembly factor BamB
MRIRWMAFSAAVMSCAGSVLGADWSNAGGNAGRNGLSFEVGPSRPDLAWDGARSSIIAWLPVTEGHRLFTVRQTGFPPEPNSNESTIVCLDLATGDELWHRDLPYEANDWTTWVGGVMNGRVYASRAGNGASVQAVLYCLDAATGATLWTTDSEIDAGAYDGLVFADDGDPVIGSFRDIWRFNAEDGTLVWHADRQASVSGNCGGAIGNGGFYIADADAGGQVIKKFDLQTGQFLYQGPAMPGFLVQNTPTVGPDGSIYFNRVQNNQDVDFFYAFADTGSAIVEKWNIPAHYGTSAEFGIGPDGSVYMAIPGKVIARLNPDTGDILDQTDPLAGDFFSPRFAIDSQGTVFFGNSSFSDGALHAFTPDLEQLWSVPVPNINIGGPALAQDGTLVVCGVGQDVRAYRTPVECYPDFDGDDELTLFDFLGFVNEFNAGEDRADCTADGAFDLFDFLCFVNAFNAGC